MGLRGGIESAKENAWAPLTGGGVKGTDAIAQTLEHEEQRPKAQRERGHRTASPYLCSSFSQCAAS